MSHKSSASTCPISHRGANTSNSSEIIRTHRCAVRLPTVCSHDTCTDSYLRCSIVTSLFASTVSGNASAVADSHAHIQIPKPSSCQQSTSQWNHHVMRYGTNHNTSSAATDSTPTTSTKTRCTAMMQRVVDTSRIWTIHCNLQPQHTCSAE